jgi:hypothetical protein
VVRGTFGIASVVDEPDDVARANTLAVEGDRGIRGEVRVVELILLLVTEPEAVPAKAVPAD